MQYCSARPLTPVKKQQQKPPNQRHTADQRFFHLIHSTSPTHGEGLDFQANVKLVCFKRDTRAKTTLYRACKPVILKAWRLIYADFLHHKIVWNKPQTAHQCRILIDILIWFHYFNLAAYCLILFREIWQAVPRMEGKRTNFLLLYIIFLLTETPQTSKFMKYWRKIIKLFISDKTIKKQTKEQVEAQSWGRTAGLLIKSMFWQQNTLWTEETCC